jgi:hypothetical protein
MDKFPDVFKAVLLAFHGIIATWLFLQFSETKVDEFYFVILLAFFSVSNLLVWKAILIIARRLHLTRLRRFLPAITTLDVAYGPADVIALLIIAIVLGLTAAYVERNEFILEAANKITNWERTSENTPFYTTIAAVRTRNFDHVDSRPPDQRDAAKGLAYVRIRMKDGLFGYEGYPGLAPSKLEVREMLLTPACRMTFDDKDRTKIVSIEQVEGPGVFLPLDNMNAMEIIDYRQSRCVQLQSKNPKG